MWTSKANGSHFTRLMKAVVGFFTKLNLSVHPLFHKNQWDNKSWDVHTNILCSWHHDFKTVHKIHGAFTIISYLRPHWWLSAPVPAPRSSYGSNKRNKMQRSFLQNRSQTASFVPKIPLLICLRERQTHTQPTICSIGLLTVNYAAINEHLHIIQLTGM